MAELSWAREAGAVRRRALDREAPRDHTTLVGAMFDGHVNALWRRLSVAFQETVEAYNEGGQFSDVKFAATNERLVAERRHDPRFVIELRLDRAARQLLLITTDPAGEADTERLEFAFVDGDLTLWHNGQPENGYPACQTRVEALSVVPPFRTRATLHDVSGRSIIGPSCRDGAATRPL